MKLNLTTEGKNVRVTGPTTEVCKPRHRAGSHGGLEARFGMLWFALMLVLCGSGERGREIKLA